MGQKVNSEEYLRYIICKEMKWDYYTYMNQPEHFLEEITIFIVQEGEKANRDAKISPSSNKPKGYSRG